jgi:hypothetical protein
MNTNITISPDGVPDDELSSILLLIDREPMRPDAVPSMNDLLTRLCRAAARALPATGVGVTVMTSPSVRGLSAASSARSELVEELQFTLGEGPCRDAYATREPVLVGDLSREGARWPMYCAAALGHGVEAVFAFPLSAGAEPLGMMDIYQDHAGPLTPPELSQALLFAEATTKTVLDNLEHSGTDRVLQEFDHDLNNRLELYQAQGMLIIQLGTDLDGAMARMRAYAYATDRRLSEVAHDIVTRRLTFDPDAR